MAATYNYDQWIMGQEINIAQNAVAHLKTMLPEASISPASTEAHLIESLSIMVGPIMAAHQVLPSRVVDHLMTLYGLERYPGYRAEGKVRVTVNPTATEVKLPAGTVLRHYLASSNELREYRTVEDLLILPAESITGEVRVEATSVGTEHNGLPVGASLDAVDSYFIDIDRFEISESPRGGEGPESNESWWERSRAQLERQVSTLVVPDQFRSAALTRGEVNRAYVLDLYNPAAPTVEAPGHVTLAVTDSEGLPLTPRERPALEAWLQDQAMASLQVHVIDATYTTINPTVVVEATPGATLSIVETAVRDQLARWLSPTTWEWWPEITPYDYVSALDDVAGVARVITVPQKVTLTGKAPLPKLGTVTVTVNPSTRGGA